MYTVAIIDDDLDTLHFIKSEVEKIFIAGNVSCKIHIFNNPTSLDSNIIYDALLLDIDMPPLNGIDLAKDYSDKHEDTYIIFITDRHELVFKAFSVHPFDFLKKENLTLTLPQTITHLIKKLNLKHQSITLASKTAVFSIEYRNIIYCESYGHNCYIHTTHDVIKTNKYKLSTIDKLLNSPDFYMINQSYLVNWRHVMKIENKSVTLNNLTTLPISKRRLKSSLNAFKTYTLKNI